MEAGPEPVPLCQMLSGSVSHSENHFGPGPVYLQNFFCFVIPEEIWNQPVHMSVVLDPLDPELQFISCQTSPQSSDFLKQTLNAPQFHCSRQSPKKSPEHSIHRDGKTGSEPVPLGGSGSEKYQCSSCDKNLCSPPEPSGSEAALPGRTNTSGTGPGLLPPAAPPL